MADISAIANSTPFVTIEFTDEGDPTRVPVVRHWYHVPHIGDSVRLNEGSAEELDHTKDGFMAGRVVRVIWDDGNAVSVVLK